MTCKAQGKLGGGLEGRRRCRGKARKMLESNNQVSDLSETHVQLPLRKHRQRWEPALWGQEQLRKGTRSHGPFQFPVYGDFGIKA